MASMQDRLTELITAIGADIKTLQMVPPIEPADLFAPTKIVPGAIFTIGDNMQVLHLDGRPIEMGEGSVIEMGENSVMGTI